MRSGLQDRMGRVCHDADCSCHLGRSRLHCGFVLRRLVLEATGDFQGAHHPCAHVHRQAEHWVWGLPRAVGSAFSASLATGQGFGERRVYVSGKGSGRQ